LNITNRQVLILTTEDRDSYWVEDKFKEFQDYLQIFHDFNILSMTLLSYINDKNQYTVIIYQDISDLVCFEGINAFQSFLSLPFVIDGKFDFLTWCSDDGLAILVSMFWDMFSCKLAFKDSLNVPLVAEIFGENNGLLTEPADFKMCSAGTISSIGLKKPLHEQFFESQKPLGKYFVS
jgi:hypothetical protein